MLLKRWHESEFHLAEQPIRLKLKALSFEEAPPFLRKMKEHGDKARDDGNSEDIFTTLDVAFVLDCFERYVKPVGELEDEEKGKIASGRDVFAIANPGLVVSVLARLERLAILTAPAGKASSSPSTSEPAGSDASDSPAMSTEPADGPSA